jgi:alpha-beta hydrolase superfamily lysophospholipase
MMAAQTHWPQEMARLRMPLLIVQGLADRLVIPELTQSFYRDLPAEDKTLYLYAEHYHELINDLDREIPLDDIAHWLMERS